MIDDPRLDALIDAYCDGVIDEVGMAELDQAIAASPEAARRAVRGFNRHSELLRRLGAWSATPQPANGHGPGARPALPRLPRRSRAWMHRTLSVLVTATLPLVILLIVASRRHPGPERGPSQDVADAPSVAASGETTHPTKPQSLIAAHARWSYRADGVIPPDDWVRADFDDAQWPTGKAVFGYDLDHPERRFDTFVEPSRSVAGTLPMTTWFRHVFTLDDPTPVRRLMVRLKRDNGAVIHLNGIEVARSAMPEGPITPATPAQPPAVEQPLHVLEISPQALHRGRNCVAVEVHQRTGTSGDMLFSLELVAEIAR
jgi:hypothetical protein